jgi:hypothetical protein
MAWYKGGTWGGYSRQIRKVRAWGTGLHLQVALSGPLKTQFRALEALAPTHTFPYSLYTHVAHTNFAPTLSYTPCTQA